MHIDLLGKGLDQELLSIEKKGELLEKSVLGRGLAWRELQALAGFFEAYRAEAGSTICHQGEPGDFLCLLCQGRVDIVKQDHSHTDKIIASLGPGNTLGEMSLLDGEPRSAEVVAHTPVIILILTQENFELLADHHPRLWGTLILRLARILSKRLRLTSGILAEYLQE